MHPQPSILLDDEPAATLTLPPPPSAGINSEPRVIRATVAGLGAFDFEIHGCEDHFISGDLARDHVWEPYETEIFRRLCRPGDFVLDIGANIGWYSVVASRLVGSGGRVLALEPGSHNFALLRRNLARSAGDASVETRCLAAGDSISRTALFLSENNFGDHRLFDDGSDRASQQIEMQSLDALLHGRDPLPALVKSDTQGSEARILTGANRLFAQGWRPVWLLEFWPYGLVNAGADPISLWRRLVSLGYHTHEVSQTSLQLLPLTETYLQEKLASDISPASMGFLNILALPEQCERFSHIEDLLSPTKVSITF